MNIRRCIVTLLVAIAVTAGIAWAQSELYVEQTQNVETFKSAIFGGDFCKGANILGVVSSGRAFKIFDVSTFKEKLSVAELPMRMSSLSFSAAGQTAFLGGADGNVYVLNSETGEIKNTFSVHTSSIIGLRLSTSENLLYTVGNDHLLQITNAVTGNNIKTWSLGEEDLTAFIASPSNKFLAIGLSTGEVKVFNAQQLEPLLSWKDSKSGILTLAYSPDEKLLAAGTASGAIYVWDMQSGILKTTMTQPTLIKALAFDPQTRWLASASIDSSLTFYDVATSVVRKKIKNISGYITYLSFVNHESLVAGTSQGMLQSWKVLPAPPDTTNPTITIEQPATPSLRVFGTEYEIRGGHLMIRILKR